MNRKIFILIVVADTLFFAAVVAFLLYRFRTVEPENAAETVPVEAASSFGSEAWPIFRGDAALTGVAEGRLSARLELKWKYKTADAIKSSPIIAEGRVYVGSSDGVLYAIDLADGSQVWQFKTKDVIEAPPLYRDGLVYAGSHDSFLYAVDARSGERRWSFETGGTIVGSANVTEHQGKPAILVGSYDSRLYCLDAESGDVLWEYESGNYFNGAPAVRGARAVLGGCDAYVHIVNTDTGQAVETIDAGAYIAGSATVYDDVLYVGNYEGVILAAQIDTGRIVWRLGGEDDSTGEPSFCIEEPCLSSPAMNDSLVLLGCQDNRLHALDRATGKPLWDFASQGFIDSSAVICGDRAVFGSADGRVYIVSLVDGAEVWSYEVGAAISASPAIAADRVVIAAEDGFVYAFGPAASATQ